MKSINNIVQTNKDSTESEDEEQFFIGSIEDDLTFSEDTKWCIDLDTAGTIIKYKIDSGAQANILPVKHDKLSNSPKLDICRIKLSVYNDTKIPVKGSCMLDVKHHIFCTIYCC